MALLVSGKNIVLGRVIDSLFYDIYIDYERSKRSFSVKIDFESPSKMFSLIFYTSFAGRRTPIGASISATVATFMGVPSDIT